MQFGNLNLWEQQRLVEADSRNTDPLSTLFSGFEWDLDYTIQASYDSAVNDQLLKNLIASPDSGASQSAYDQNLGSTASADANDPEILGTIGESDCRASFDGTEWHTIAAGANTAYIDNWHKTNVDAQNFAVFFAGKMPASGRVNFFGTGQSGGSGRTGWDAALNDALSPNFIDLQQHGDASPGGTSQRFRLIDPGVAYGGNFFIGFGFDHGTGTAYIWANSSTPNTTSLTLLTSVSDAFREFDLMLNANGGPENGTEIKACSAMTRIPSSSEVGQLIDRYENRHGDTYS